MSTNTSTSQFHTSNMGQESEAGAVVVRGSGLYYFVPGGDHQVKIDTCNITSLQGGDIDGVKQNTAWTSFALTDRITEKNGANFNSVLRPAAALLGSTIYFFWVDTATSGQVYMASMDATGAFSACAYKIYRKKDSDTSPLAVSSYLSANVAPNGTVITLNWFDTSGKKLCTLVLDPANIDPTNKQWVGTVGMGVSQPQTTTIDASYYRISTAWFTQGALKATSAGAVSSSNFMVASFYSKDDHKVCALLYPLNDDGSPASNDADHVFEIATFGAKKGFSISRDPAGRIYGIYSVNDDSYNLTCCFLDTQQIVQKDGTTSPSLTWTQAGLLNGISKNTEHCPVLTFVAENPVPNRTITLPTEEGKSKSFSCTNISHFSFALYCSGNGNSNKAYDIQCQVATFGVSSIVQGYNTITPSETYQDRRLLNLLMDGFPFPKQNLGSNVTPNRPIINYTYGASSTTTLSATMTYDYLFGVRSALSATKGIGPAYDVQFKAGPQGSYGASSATTLFQGNTVYTTPVGAAPNFDIGVHGSYFGSTPSNIVEDIAIFKDASGDIISGDTAPLFSTLRPVAGNHTNPVSDTFAAYCYTPGSITSYQQTAIDATMKDRYEALSAANKAYFTPDYATSYIDKVIIPNAERVLSFTINAAGNSGSQLEVIDKVLSTVGYTVQGSAYAGVSGGEEFSIFGFGEAFQLSLLAGFEYKFAVTSGVEGTTTWGISYNINTPGEVEGAIGYSVKMYICGPSNMWARELELFANDVDGKSSIDFDNSKPSKIMFVVSNILVA